MDLDASENRPAGADALTTFESRDIDFVAERLTSISGTSSRIDYFGNPNDFSMSFAATKLDRLLLSTTRVTNSRLIRSMGNLTNIAIPISGTPLKIRCGTRSYEISAGNLAAVTRPFEEVEVDLHEGSAMVLHAPIETLIERAERIAGESLSGSPISRMVDRVSLRSPVGEALARTVKAALVELGALNSAGLGPLAVAGYEDMLANLAAAALFPEITEGLGRPAAQCGPVTIRRARDFIKAHAADPISISRLAADLGLPMRTLQDNFRRFFGLSPRAWLIECRLENARQRLTLPDRPTSVSMVAYDCGFGDLSGFSAKYRRRYGEAPSETLRVAHQHFSGEASRAVDIAVKKPT